MSEKKKRSLQNRITSALVLIGIISALVAGIISPIVVTVQVHLSNLKSDRKEYVEAVITYRELYGSWDVAILTESFSEFLEKTTRTQITPEPGSIRIRSEAFLLIDTQGVILTGPPGYRGKLPVRYMKERNAVYMDGNLIAWAVPIHRPEINEADRLYIRSIAMTIIPSLMVISILAIFLGGYISRQLTGTLMELTDKIRGMKPGEDYLPIDINTNDEVGELATAFNELVHEIDESHRVLTELSTIDELTGLNNRRFFRKEADDRIDTTRRYRHPLSVMLGDLDNFKKVNDRFGHAIGDEVLKSTSSCILESTRKPDIAARWGGEEFVILLCETDLESAVLVSDRFRHTLEQKDWSAIEPGLEITISIGVAEWQEGDTLDTLLSRADANLYKAKETGRNRVVSG